MQRSVQKEELKISPSAEAKLIAAARCQEPVRGFTHGFYKYPARFSPVFVRAAIETFTNPGDLVLDNHVGGGTTLVEALATGRSAIGVDVSSLAEFVAGVKTTVFTAAELNRLEKWAKRISSSVHIHKSSTQSVRYAELGYYKHLDHPDRWRLRKAIEQVLSSAIRLKNPKLVSFGRCVALRAAQQVLDGRATKASVPSFRNSIGCIAREMVLGARSLRVAVIKARQKTTVKILHRNASGIENEKLLWEKDAPRLIITSPPYPGIHVLYHRWQVDGRKESPAPFWIANKLDGDGSSFYTMGDRKQPQLTTYFANIQATMSSVAAVADSNSIVIQVVAFSNPTWQLPRYLEAMRDAGLSEIFLPTLKKQKDGRLWRTVPGRRWYSEQRGKTPSSQEVVLFHRKTTTNQSRLRVHLHSRDRLNPAERAM